jgi:DNA-binding CsgD family transcriptional regulator
MTRRLSRPADRATDREVGVVAAVLVAGSEKAAAHRLGVSHSTVKHHLASARSKVGVTTTAQLVWILAERLPEPEGMATDDSELLDSTLRRWSQVASSRQPVIGLEAEGGRPRLARQRRDRAQSPTMHGSGQVRC